MGVGTLHTLAQQIDKQLTFIPSGSNSSDPGIEGSGSLPQMISANDRMFTPLSIFCLIYSSFILANFTVKVKCTDYLQLQSPLHPQT